MSDDLLYQIALSQVPKVGDVHARILIQHFGNAKDVFNAPKKALEKIDGLGIVRTNAIKSFNEFDSCEDEVRFIEKYNITPVFLTDKSYPKRLLNCYDCPPLLYFKGTANLNASKIVSIVGTRNSSEYGRFVCNTIVEGLKLQQILVVSGLAFGIDTIAHKAALKNQMETVGVLAHGLDRIYPSQNKSIAKHMCEQGGLLTEFKSGTNPDRENFPRRNRIVAGLCDCIIIVESGVRGGSLITAELSNGYNKDVFAIPGRINDPKSEGCNFLIKNNKANVITSSNDVLDFMNWNDDRKVKPKPQRELFIELSEAEKKIFDLVTTADTISVDQIFLSSGLSNSTVAAALLSLEMHGLVSSLPGKMYKCSG